MVGRYDTGRGQDYECTSGRYVLHSDYAALEARHNALVEAVAWERECQLVRHYVIFDALQTCALREITRSISTARAEVDRLIGEQNG